MPDFFKLPAFMHVDDELSERIDKFFNKKPIIGKKTPRLVKSKEQDEMISFLKKKEEISNLPIYVGCFSCCEHPDIEMDVDMNSTLGKLMKVINVTDEVEDGNYCQDTVETIMLALKMLFK